LAVHLDPGNAGSNTAADHAAVISAALAPLPGGRRRGKSVLVRIDGAGSTRPLRELVASSPAWSCTTPRSPTFPRDCNVGSTP